jgi:hypothetical protein
MRTVLATKSKVITRSVKASMPKMPSASRSTRLRIGTSSIGASISPAFRLFTLTVWASSTRAMPCTLAGAPKGSCRAVAISMAMTERLAPVSMTKS